MRYLKLRADNEKLRQERASFEQLNPGTASVSTTQLSAPRSADMGAGVVERFVFVS